MRRVRGALMAEAGLETASTRDAEEVWESAKGDGQQRTAGMEEPAGASPSLAEHFSQRSGRTSKGGSGRQAGM